MWCRNCQQDVPAVVSGADVARICCARCGDPFPGHTAAEGDQGAEPLSIVDFPHNSLSPPTNSLSDWKLEEELREAQRLVQAIRSQSGHHTDTNARAVSTAPQTATPAINASGILAWATTGLGLSGVICGSTLLVWSLVSGRHELWTVGLPTVLVSQVVLVCGLLLRRDDNQQPTSEEVSAASAALVQLQSSAGDIQPSGLSVHFAHTGNDSNARRMNSDELRKEIEAALRRNHAA